MMLPLSHTGRPLIPHTHNALKGSFLCLGNHYNLFNKESMEECYKIISECNKGDRITAREEIKEAKKIAETWEPSPLLGFLYKEYARQNGGETPCTLEEAQKHYINHSKPLLTNESRQALKNGKWLIRYNNFVYLCGKDKSTLRFAFNDRGVLFLEMI